MAAFVARTRRSTRRARWRRAFPDGVDGGGYNDLRSGKASVVRLQNQETLELAQGVVQLLLTGQMLDDVAATARFDGGDDDSTTSTNGLPLGPFSL